MEMDKILEELYPYSIYKEFNDELVNATDETYCNEFKTIKQDYKEKSFELCKKVTKLLEFVFKKHTSAKYKDYCSHYKNWVYQEIWKLFNEHTSNSDIDDVIKKFYKLQRNLFNVHNKNDCSYRFDFNTFEGLYYKIEEKSLYDYFKNYNTIKTSETCNKCENGKYKEYLESINDMYNNWKDPCCSYGKSVCDNYFLSCKDEFDPSELLSAFLSKGSDSCDGLNRITANFDEEKLNSKVSEPEILSSITYGTCFNLENGRLTSDIKRHPHCSLFATSVTLTRSVPTAEYGGTKVTDSGSPPGSTNLDSRSNQAEVDASRRGQPDAKGKRGDFGDSGVKIEAVPPVKDAAGPIRWKFDERGTLQCPSKSINKYEELLCEYMDVLVEGNFATQIEGTGRYKVKVGTKWTEADLKLARERVRKRRSANESNILNNIFVRISTGVTLFTPFGSRLRRHRKRKQRYRFDFTDLCTRKRPRRFLKRTYRHSDRRRFNVVNIDDELHSSNDLQNIN
ncbi:PIR protein [Plasmodium brasilianum]|uniref:PIR Superfamily Protein n=2 Tax=Plasmodium (Plasmodium) TaxID=418103 RepID=A0A1A8X5D8_PLAMA|nr:PIR protein [Plasmodium brasilianum]SBT00476.1 PIR Superfamily Protein [Plasmodium malariae]